MIKNTENKYLPTISIVIATFNSKRTLSLCLSKVTSQDYPASKIQIIVADGGSNDTTKETARKFGARIISVDPKLQNAEYNKAIGLSYAKGEIVLFLDHDNIMPHNKWLKKITRPFIENKEVILVEPLRFHYSPKMTLLDRYFALYGGSDPVIYYLGKNSHLSWAYDHYNLMGRVKNYETYYVVEFTPPNIPALGGNGAAFRRKILLGYAKSNPEDFLHTDVAADLIRNGYNTVAFIKDSIMHLTNNEMFPFLLRRRNFIESYYFRKKRRRFLLYDPKKDNGLLALYIFMTITLIVPFMGAIRGYRKIHDFAWFIHPFMCYAFLIVYGYAVIKVKTYELLGK